MPSTVENRMAGAKPVKSIEEGLGEVLRFVSIPNSLSGEIINTLSGLDYKFSHPLAGATYLQQREDRESFRLLVFQGEMEQSLCHAFKCWHSRGTLLGFADKKTVDKLYGPSKT